MKAALEHDGRCAEMSARWRVGRSLDPVRVILSVLAAFGFFFLTLATVYAGNLSYLYDMGGRLLAVFDGNGSVTNYQYDLDGNITAVLTETTSTLAIYGYSPDQYSQSQSPTQVVIYGNNFSPTPSQNSVTFFNGMGSQPATVLSASSTQLTVSVPNTGGIGPVTVTCPSGTVQGPNFN